MIGTFLKSTGNGPFSASFSVLSAFISIFELIRLRNLLGCLCLLRKKIWSSSRICILMVKELYVTYVTYRVVTIFDSSLPRLEPRLSSEESRPEYSSLFHILPTVFTLGPNFILFKECQNFHVAALINSSKCHQIWDLRIWKWFFSLINIYISNLFFDHFWRNDRPFQNFCKKDLE